MKIAFGPPRTATVAALSILAGGSLIGHSLISKETKEQEAVRQKSEDISRGLLRLVKDLDCVVERDAVKAVASKDPDLRYDCKILQIEIGKIEKLLTGQNKNPDPHAMELPETKEGRLAFVEQNFKRLKELRGEVTSLHAEGRDLSIPVHLCEMRSILRAIHTALGMDGLPEFNLQKALAIAKALKDLKRR